MKVYFCLCFVDFKLYLLNIQRKMMMMMMMNNPVY